jgi:signal transduction histidine kinase
MSRRTSLLREIERVVGDLSDDLEFHEASERAHRRALALSAAASPGTTSEAIAVVGFAADLVVALAPRLTLRENGLRTLVDRLEATARISRCALGREVMRAPQLLSLAPPPALEFLLELVMTFTEARAAVLLAHAPDGKLTMLAQAGNVDAMPAESQDIADTIIAGHTVTARNDGDLAAVTIQRWRSPPAALVVFGQDVLSPGRRLLLESAEPLLTLALAHRLQVNSGSGGSATGESRCGEGIGDAVTAPERRLTRLRFDLHDGPQQDVLMLAEDLKLFRVQLESLVSGEHRAGVLGRVDDLEARLVALDGDLRRISVSAQSPFLHQKTFEDALDTVVEGFTARSGLTPAIRLDGDFTRLTDSQHITLLGLIREALSNVREHSDAAHVTVAVSNENGAVGAQVTDDGRGFDPETMLVRAARSGHLGLVGMHERVSLLGGSTTITSRAGGPTVIAATLPPAPAGTPRRGDR